MRWHEGAAENALPVCRTPGNRWENRLPSEAGARREKSFAGCVDKPLMRAILRAPSMPRPLRGGGGETRKKRMLTECRR